MLSVEELDKQIKETQEKIKQSEITQEDLYLMYNTMDLTSLNSTDGPESIEQFLQEKYFQVVQKNQKLFPAAICVFPNFTKQVQIKLKGTNVKTAVVSTCFPTGQTFKEVKDLETQLAVKNGAQEIDMVVSRGLYNENDLKTVQKEIKDQKKICKKTAHLKVILENSDLKDIHSIYKLSYIALECGADFIKTSTGKGSYGCKLDQFIAMLIALKEFQDKTQEKRGIKAAGGIRNSTQAKELLQAFEIVLGQPATPEFFRIGASSLASDIISQIKEQEPAKKDQE